MSVTHRARMERCLAGKKPDRTPVALWRHFPVDDQSPVTLAAAVVAFQRTFDFDLIKVTPASSYCVKDWGIQDRWEGNPEGTRRYLEPIIHSPEDWATLNPLSPKRGVLGATLECLRLLVHEFSPHTPILHTIFSPLSQAKNLVGKENLLVHLRRNPAELHDGLERITETTLTFVEEVVKTGVDGIFFAEQFAQFGLLARDEFEEFCQPYDLSIFEASRGLWLNMLHLHGSQVRFSDVQQFPLQIINWHDRETEPSLSKAQESFPGVVCGGLRQWDTMLLADPAQVTREAQQAIEATGGMRFLLGTGCVLPTTAPYGNILAARQSVESFAGVD